MKAWSIKAWHGKEYADLYPYFIPSNEIVCNACLKKKPIKRMEAHWEEGSDKIGDFTAATGRLVVKESIADILLDKFSGFEKIPITYKENPRYKKSTKKKPLIPYPYDRESLVEIWINCEIEFHSTSTVEIESQCESCGRILYKKFYGIEERDSRKHIKRIPGKAFYFNYDHLEGSSFFKPKDTGFILCTDEVKKHIEKCKLTNVYFLEVGEFI